MLKQDLPGTMPARRTKEQWPACLLKGSVLKQQKLRRKLSAIMGSLAAKGRILGIDSDNSVISYMLRQRGAELNSANMDLMG